MSDIGIYTAIEDEVDSTIGTISGVVDVIKACDWEDLVYRVSPDGEGGRTPVIGISLAGASRSDDYAIASRRFVAKAMVEIAIAVRNERGKSDARSTMYTIVETIRDRLHYATTSQTFYKNAYKMIGEQKIKTAEDDLLVWILNYELTCGFGN